MDYFKWKIFQLFKFKEAAKLFNILKLRYGTAINSRCNQLLKTRLKMHSLNCKIDFLQQCLLNGIIPKWLFARIKSSKLKQSMVIESIFLKNEIGTNENLLRKLIPIQKDQLEFVQEHLSFTDLIELLKFISVSCKRFKANQSRKNHQSLNFLKSKRFGTVQRQHINNTGRHSNWCI